MGKKGREVRRERRMGHTCKWRKGEGEEGQERKEEREKGGGREKGRGEGRKRG